MPEVLIAGTTGGREYALGAALQQEGAQITFTHGGNGGTHEIGANIDAASNQEIADYAEQAGVDLVVVGPEGPLVDGLADAVRAKGIAVYGPGRDGAWLEASKAFTAEFADAYGIRQPSFGVIRTLQRAKEYVAARDAQEYVTKADGLAGGKGALLHDSNNEALADIKEMLHGRKFGDAGRTIVFQERLDKAGPELSAMFVLDGTGNFTLLPLSQDHKQLEEGDKGPNTGGMGAYAPLLFESEQSLIDEIMDTGERLAQGLKHEDIDYRGTVYAGLMRDVRQDGKPSLLEINVRFGDPETQVVLARARQAGINMLQLLSDAANGSIDRSLRGNYIGRYAAGAAPTVCLAAGGYPDSKAGGVPILGLDRAYEGATFHHGGTRYDEETGQVLAVGGRIGYVTAIGSDADEAADRAYAAIGDGGIRFDAMRFRKDIAWQARTAA